MSALAIPPTLATAMPPVAHVLAISVFLYGMWRHLGATRHPGRDTLLAFLAYTIASEPGAKAGYLLVKSKHHPSLWKLLDPATYLEEGFWGWLLVFLPLIVAIPLVVRRMDRTAWFRAIALTLPPVIALQKMSCFFGGCCYGRRTDLPWGVIFPHRPRHRFYEVPLHPTQIYDAALALSWLLVLTLLDRNKALRPYLFPVFVLLYCVSRFATETLRPEFRRGLATSQIFELVAAAGVLLLLTVGRPLWARFLAGRPEAAA